ncbi:hypothetical protein [Burkholderia pseudomallei]|uniref:hypothetical protein n=1 Tax=Burkholderia pseudomallei TaxID=28450 RepID=UPI0011AB7C1E|nr:hypothetical protein [Burkholderia pseudomallei]
MKVKAEIGESHSDVLSSTVETRMWTDEKFIKLSRIPPCGQGLWVYLLTGPHTRQPHMVPGVYLVSRAALAEALQWSLDEFDEIFSQIFGRKMAVADWDNHILWLPNALRRHSPRSPKNVLGWRTGWSLIPDCPLKRRIYRAVKSAIFGRGVAFQEAFEQAVTPVGHGVAGRTKNRSSTQLRCDHKSKDDAIMSANMIAEPLTEVNTAPRRIRAHARKGFKTYEEPKTLKPKTKPTTNGNGATAPLTRARPHAYCGADEESPEALPDKARSEFASVLRLKNTMDCEQTQRDLFNETPRKPAPDKARANYDTDHDRIMSANMIDSKAPRKSRKAPSDKAQGPDTGPAWNAYSEAYFGRYGAQPVRNASVNAQMLNFVKRVGKGEAPAVARFYVERCTSAHYLKRCHAVGLLLQDAEALRTQWATQRPMTATEAAMADRTATNANAFGPLIAEAHERERNEAKHDH